MPHPAVPSEPAVSESEPDPRPLRPKEPALEDCCCTGCVHCVFDMYQIALENYERALEAWEARHPGQAGSGA